MLSIGNSLRYSYAFMPQNKVARFRYLVYVMVKLSYVVTIDLLRQRKILNLWDDTNCGCKMILLLYDFLWPKSLTMFLAQTDKSSLYKLKYTRECTNFGFRISMWRLFAPEIQYRRWKRQLRCIFISHFINHFPTYFQSIRHSFAKQVFVIFLLHFP